MIEIQEIKENLIELRISGRLEVGDFEKIAPQVDKVIQDKGAIYLLIDGSSFDGWSNFSAAKEHFQFVKKHHKKVISIALITGHLWQRCLLAFARVFVHPEIKTFDQNKRAEAEQWLDQKANS